MRESTIVQCGQAILCALGRLTGQIASGQMRMRALPGKQFILDRYDVWVGVPGSAQEPSWLFKVGEGPNEDGSWIIGDSDVLVDVYSNIGGKRFNLDVGARLIPQLPIDELDLSSNFAPNVLIAFEGGQDPQGDYGWLRDMALYETFDGPLVHEDVRRSPIKQFPALLVAFQDLMPVWGGATTSGSDRFYNMTYSLSVIVSKSESDHRRRHQGLLALDDICRELLNLNSAPDGDLISNPNGLIIKQAVRESGPQDIYKKFYIYTLFVVAQRALTRNEHREFVPWLRTRMDIDHPQHPPLPNQGTLEVVDNMLIRMNSGQIDISLDGTFTRSSVATYWDSRLRFLLSYPLDTRRIINGALLIEPTLIGALGNDSSDFDVWTELNGAVVGARSESNPAGNSNQAYVVTFAADEESALELPAQVVTPNKPIVFYVFVKATGLESFRLVVDDGVAAQESLDLSVDDAWQRLRFECTPLSSPVTLRIQNATDGAARSLVLWGATFDDDARWGPEYVAVAKSEDRLEFTTAETPAQMIDGAWKLKLRTLPYVPPDLTGAGQGLPLALVSLGDGATDLLLLTLVGTPDSGGARFAISTRAGGEVFALDGVSWKPGSLITLRIEAVGVLAIDGTSNVDGEYTFPGYASQASVDDHLRFGGDTTGTRGGVPGFYTVETI